MDLTRAHTTSSANAADLRSWMRRHPLVSFFGTTYAVSWIFLLAEVLTIWGVLPDSGRSCGGTSASCQVVVLNVLFTFGPAFAAIVVTSLLEGREGVTRLRQRIRQVRAGWVWYGCVLVGIPALLVGGLLIQPGILAGFKGFPPAWVAIYLVNFVVIWFGGGPLGEEVGWRGFALPRLQARHGALKGSVVLGLAWAVWHLPQYLTPIQGGGPGTGLATVLTNYATFTVMVVALAILLTWLFNHTNGSLFMAITAHASVNIVEVAVTPLFPAIGYSTLLVAGAVSFGAFALLVTFLTRGRLGYSQQMELTPQS